VGELDLEGRALSLLQSCSTMTLATAGPEGIWAADVFFAAEGTTRLYYLSSLGTRHGRNSLADPAAAATVHPEVGKDWRAIRGLQIEGEAHLLENGDLASAEAAYFAKFPFAAGLLQPNSEVADKTSSTRFFELRVARLFLVDNSLGFGNRQEITVGP
jgi:uncharacterized protein YhbP (UPF0306 family)